MSSTASKYDGAEEGARALQNEKQKSDAYELKKILKINSDETKIAKKILKNMLQQLKDVLLYSILAK